MNYQPVINIANIVCQLGVRNVVLSPGSRNAPLIISFSQHTGLNTYSISDERSAAFIALGLALKTASPVVIACTSGSAAYNYAPAVAEAFYQKIPLIVMTADRPPEWIDQQDGQAIKQSNIYGNHVLGSYQCPVDTSHPDAAWHFERIISDAFNEAATGRQGPVHINIPFREPFYPKEETPMANAKPKSHISAQTEREIGDRDWATLIDQWAKLDKKLILTGQGHPSETLLSHLDYYQKENFIPVLGDVLSNIHPVQNVISLGETYLGNLPKSKMENLQPDLLITIGKSILSKNVKLFLREFHPKEHWHIDADGPWPDTFKSLTRIIPVSPESFFAGLKEIGAKGSPKFLKEWQNLENKIQKFNDDFHINCKFNEFSAVNSIVKNLPLACDIHLANSMPVRWVNLIGIDHTHHQINIFANRGTCGIDGCTSTTIGSAMATDKTTLLISGDIAFFYDRNAFWNKYISDNLRVIVLNNHGGGIFDIIDGPSNQAEHEEYFLTSQPLKAASLASEFGLSYFLCTSFEEVSAALDKFWVRDGKAKILEIETNIKINTASINSYKKQVQKLWN